MQWHKIHDFLYGWGFREFIPDNEIVHKEEGNVRYVSSKQEERVLYLRDTQRLLNIDIFDIPQDELEEVYNKLQPLLEAEWEERRKHYQANPIQFTKITIPKINQLFPKLLT